MGAGFIHMLAQEITELIAIALKQASPQNIFLHTAAAEPKAYRYCLKTNKDTEHLLFQQPVMPSGPTPP